MTPLCPQNFNCTMGDISGESAGHARTRIFLAYRSCVQILATCGHASSCCTLRWWSWMNGTTMGLRISFHGLTVHSKLNQNAPVFVAHTVTPPPPWATRSKTLTSAKCSPSQCCLPYLPVQNLDWSVKTTVQSKPHRKWAFPTQVNFNEELHLSPVRMMRMQMSFAEMVSGSLWRCFLVSQTYCCSSCPGSWSQTILEVKVLHEQVLGRCVYTWSAAGWASQFSEMPL